MKFKHTNGEYAFKALYKTINGWELSKQWFFTAQEVVNHPNYLQVVWPVEIQDGQIVYVPSQEELE